MLPKNPEWEQFEKTIADFLSSLDKNAKITHDAKIPDIDTGALRQRDVWVEATVCGMFPIKIYVSCKFISKKISQQDMDAVIGEFRSSGANKGVIYSKTGFTKEAIKKAKAVDICCCKLYKNQPPDLPETLIFKSYVAKTSIMFSVLNNTNNSVKTYNDLFKLNGKEFSKNLLDEVQSCYQELEKKAIQQQNLKNRLPQNWQTTLKIETGNNGEVEMSLSILWNIFEASSKAFLINGSYSFTEGFFAGMQTTPVIDLKSFHPGKGWNLISDISNMSEINGNSLVMFLTHGDCKQALIDSLGTEELKISNN